MSEGELNEQATCNEPLQVRTEGTRQATPSGSPRYLIRGSKGTVVVDGWRKASIGRLGKVVTGTTPSTAARDYYGGDIPFISPSDLGKSLFVDRAERTLTPAGFKQAKAVPPGSILFTCIGATIGKAAIAGRELATNQQINAVICDPQEADSTFVYYLLSLRADHIKRLAGAQAIPIVNKSTFEAITAPVPPLPEQRKIAEILRTWDEAIEKLEGLRAAKERQNHALIHALVFGTRQLDRFQTTGEITSYRWFTQPAAWGYESIGKLANEISERNTDGDKLEVLSCSKHDGFVRSLEYFKKQVFSSDLVSYKKIWHGDFGFPSNHVEEGSIGLQNLTDIGLVSPIYTVFRFASDKVDPEYAFAVLKTELYRHIFRMNTSASVDRRGSLRWGAFSKLPFPMPSLAEQQSIAKVLGASKVELYSLTAEIKALTRQKRGLMQKLLTGEWRVQPD